ncbi:MAG TPA: dihydrolipoamide acetyltransferase family protein [Candidatus Brocadiia bacterium]|nr:dihydrolipoamide acetyltransferase family protein [Candidatus Brocadiia bacterium]
MLRKLCMPKLGETMKEGTVGEWKKKEGDFIKVGDVILEITTDKATLEVESFEEWALLKILAQPGELLPVNTPIAIMGDKGDKLPDDLSAILGADAPAKPAIAAQGAAQGAAQTAQNAPPNQTARAADAQEPGRLIASPRAKKLASDEKIPLQILRGSGPNGRIVEQDVSDYLAKRKAIKATPTALEVAYQKAIDLLLVKPSGADGRITVEDVEKSLSAPAAPAAPAPTPKTAAVPMPVAGEIPLTNMRRTIAARMTQSKQTVPHFYLFTEADMTAAAVHRAQINATGDAKVSFNDMVVAAMGNALKLVPIVNRQWRDGKIIQLDTCNVSIAVASDDGLMVPVLRDVPSKGLRQIASESRALIEKARKKALLPDEYVGGSCTVSNVGVFGIGGVFAIINTPESFIIGVGAIKPKVVAIDGGIHIRSMMGLTLSGDHRAIDGASGAQFLKAVTDLLENPATLRA